MSIHTDKNGYVYEIRSYRVKGVSYPKQDRKCIGKMVDGTFQPNGYYSERLEKEEAWDRIKELEEQLKAKTKEAKEADKKMEAALQRKQSGLHLLLSSLLESSGLMKALVTVFGEKMANKIASIAQYFISSRCAAMNDFTYFDRSQKHFCESSISSTESSRIFASITEEDVNRFYKEFQTIANRKSNKKEEYYYAFDSTAFSSYSQELSCVEVSKGKQDAELEHFALAAIHSTLTDGCFYHRIYRGNIPDIKTARDFVNVAKAMGYRPRRMIFDRGYASIENIHLIQKELDAEIMVMLKSNTKIFNSAVEKAGEAFKGESRNYIPQQKVYGTTAVEEIELNEGSSLRGFVHVYYSSEKATEETEKLHLTVEDGMQKLARMAESGELTVADASAGKFIVAGKKYIRVRKTSNRTVVFEKDDDAITKKTKSFGYFCIYTSERMDASKALLTYRGRDGVERLFNMLKNDLGFTRAGVENDSALEGKVFCVMFAAQLVSIIRSKMREHRDKLGRKLTYNKVIHEMESIYSYPVKGNEVWAEISDRQRLILDCLGVPAPYEPETKVVKKVRAKKLRS